MIIPSVLLVADRLLVSGHRVKKIVGQIFEFLGIQARAAERIVMRLKRRIR